MAGVPIFLQLWANSGKKQTHVKASGTEEFRTHNFGVGMNIPFWAYHVDLYQSYHTFTLKIKDEHHFGWCPFGLSPDPAPWLHHDRSRKKLVSGHSFASSGGWLRGGGELKRRPGRGGERVWRCFSPVKLPFFLGISCGKPKNKSSQKSHFYGQAIPSWKVYHWVSRSSPYWDTAVSPAKDPKGKVGGAAKVGKHVFWDSAINLYRRNLTINCGFLK